MPLHRDGHGRVTEVEGYTIIRSEIVPEIKQYEWMNYSSSPTRINAVSIGYGLRNRA